MKKRKDNIISITQRENHHLPLTPVTLKKAIILNSSRHYLGCCGEQRSHWNKKKKQSTGTHCTLMTRKPIFSSQSSELCASVYICVASFTASKEDEILYALSLLQSILFWCLDQWDFSILSDFGKSVFLDEDSIFKDGLEKILPQVQNKN